MVRGHMSCGIVASTLMVRFAPAEADRLLNEPNVRPMDFTGRPMRGFITMHRDGLKGVQLNRWIDAAVARADAPPRK